MNKFLSYALAILVVVAFATPLVSASSETGSGTNRTVTFNDSFVDTNTTVVVPTILNNATDNSFAFVVSDESGVWGSNYAFNITIYDNNVTWYNGTVNIVGTPSENTTGYINFTANTFDLVNDANITITMQWSNWTATNDDVWWGTVDIVDANTYTISVVTVDLMVSVLGMGMLILFIGKVMGSMGEMGSDKKKKK
jgi:hypothetical protein